jgi:creatinine amidohydrolase
MLDCVTATWPEVETAIQKGCIAILAVGAQEQHGAHCPLATDTIMSAGLARRLAQRLDALLLPPIPYGEAWSNARFPGTISISFGTLKALVADIILSLQRSGVAGLVVVNGHYGNRAPIEIAFQEALSERPFPLLMLNYPGMQRLAGEICESKPTDFSFYHADEFETSIVLALQPGAVQMDKARASYPDFPPTFASEPLYLDSFNPSGVFGDPRPATAAKGERLLAGLEEECLKIIEPFLKEHGIHRGPKGCFREGAENTGKDL